MSYRTRTYIAGDWTGDKAVIDKLYEWNQSVFWGLSFLDAHELTQSRDTSKPCSIKKSLATRLDASKTFVLIVGSGTIRLTKGSCQWCDSYDSYHWSCHAGGYVDYRSFIEYECEKACRDGLKIVVIYNSMQVDRSKCPEVLRNKGKHIPFYYFDNGKLFWNHNEIMEAIMVEDIDYNLF